MDQISLSIPKFSYATSTIPSSSSAAWTHITSAGHSNLKADFYIQGTGGFIQKTRTLRISRDHEVLENLDLNWLAQEVAHSAAAMGSGATSVRSPIAVIVKSPCLAVRYQTNQQIRRFQIKFGSNEDYMKAVSILSDAGCPITESATIQPPSKQSQSQFESQSHFQTFHQSQSGYGVGQSQTAPFTIQQQTQLPAVGPPSMSLHVPALHQPNLQNYQNASPASSVCSPIKPSYQPGGLSLSTVESPATTPSWQSAVDNSQRPVTHSGRFQQYASGASTMSTTGQGNGMDSPVFQSMMGRPSTSPVPVHNPSAMPPPPLPPTIARANPFSTNHVTDNDDLPPKRDLPFLTNMKENRTALPATGPNKQNINSNQSSKVTKTPTIAPLGKGKKSLGVKPTYTPTAQKTLTDKPFKSPLKKSLPQTINSTSNAGSNAPSPHTMGTAASIGSARNGNDNANQSLIPDMFGSGVTASGPAAALPHSGTTTIVTPSSGIATTAPALTSYYTSVSANNAPSSISSISMPPPSIMTTLTRQAQQQQQNQTTEGATYTTPSPSIGYSINSSLPWRAETLSSATTSPISSSDLAADLSAYTATPTPERMAAIESWVCAQLEDEGFLKLCEDVENVWRRIGYGF